MKPAPCDLVRASTLAEAIAALSAAGDDAKVIAGGQSLVPLMAFRLARPSLLVDLGAIPALDHIEVTAERVRIGATATHRSVEIHPDIRRRLPVVVDALSHLGHVAIRNAGTVGGSLAHADPAAEWGAVALALDGIVHVTGPRGERQVLAENFFLSWMAADLAVGDIVTALEMRMPPSGSGWGFAEVARRRGDFGIAGAGAVLSTSANGTISTARVAVLGLGLTPLRARNVEMQLVGRTPTPDRIQAACAAIDDDIAPLADQHGAVAYKRHLARVVAARAVEQAARRTGREA